MDRESDSITFIKYIKLNEIVAEFRVEPSHELLCFTKKELQEKIDNLVKDDLPHDESSYAMKYWPIGY